jgi:hypothetical protein
MRKNISELELLLGYELTASSRHRRFVSLVMLTSDNTRRSDLERLLEGAVRDSDTAFCLNDGAVVLMGETDSTGAMRAIERYKNTINDRMDVRFAISSFPVDGKAPADLMHTAERRLKRAQALNSGAVVTEG